MLQGVSELTDPTQVMPWGVTLLTCEVNLASICASVPVFWGVLEVAVIDQWDKIFVTKEVTVVRSSRHEHGDGDDERDLTHRSSSRNESITTDFDTELSDIVSDPRKKTTDHYKDEFVRAHIDPLQCDGLGDTKIESQSRTSRL